ncbi:MAG TPA: PAS domain-containing protein [Candidatus Acidoferrum sp.]|nr:PAS domain-containing protein [Candidatus Acidoferrum sp.]
MALRSSPETPVNTLRWARIEKPILRVVVCIAAVVAVTAALYAVPLERRPLTSTLGYLFVVLIVSATWGFRYSLFTSLLAALGFSLLLPLVGRLWLSDPRDVLVLAALLVIGITTSRLSDRARREALNARRSEKQLRDVIETIPAMAFSIRSDGSTEFVNRRVLEYTGLPEEMISGPGWQSTVHTDDLERHRNKWRASMASGQPLENEVRHRSADGEYRWFLIRAVPLRYEHGKILKWYGILTDIDDRKRAEALLTGEKRILEMMAKGDSLAQILDSLCRLVEEQTTGVLTSILLLDGNRLRHGAAPSLPKAYADAIDGVVIGPSVGSCGTAAYRAEQVIVEDIATDPLWADYREAALPHSLRACWSTPVFSTQGKVIATFAMYYREPRSPSPRDQEIIEQITHLAGVVIARKLTQEALQRSEAYLAEAQKLSHTGSWAWSPVTRETPYWSEEMFRIFGLDPQQGPPANETFRERVHPEDRDSVFELMRKAAREKKEYEHDHRIVLPDGSVKHIHAIGHPVLDRAGDVVEFVGTAVDVTERKRAEEALGRSEWYLAQAQRLTHTGSWAYNPSAEKAIYWSEEEFRIYGLDPEHGPPTSQAYWERVHAEDRDSVRELTGKAFREKADFTQDYRIVLPDGTVKHIHEIGHPVLDEAGNIIEYVGTEVDVTERKSAEEERERLRQLETDLAHVNRVSMMGELSASLAHEIKQPIAAAITNANTSLRWLARDKPDLVEAREAIMRILKDGTRAAEIINRLRSFYKKGAPPQPELVDLNEVAREMLSLLRNDANRYSIAMRAELALELPKVMADRVQLQQVFMNLIFNAIEAMKDTTGEITIKSQLGNEGQPLISVSDTGVGLPADEADQIFNAFFTTKPQGTGMGLAITRSIIEAHGGRLWASANIGRGATFHFTLPNEATVSSTSTS